MRKQKRAESREGMVTTTIALPEEMHRRLLIAAVETNTAATEIVRKVLGAWLDRRRSAAKRDHADRKGGSS